MPTADPISPALATTDRPTAHRLPRRIGGRVALALPLLLTLSACNELARFVAKPEPRPASADQSPDPRKDQPKVAAEPVAEVEPGPIPEPQEKPKPGKLYEWDGQGRKLSRIIINTDEQKARFYVGDEQVGWTTVASGLKSHPTPAGHFEVLEKSANKRSNLYGKVLGKGGRVLSSNAKAGKGQFPSGARFEGASMPYYLRLTYDGVGLHAGPIPHPGRPASHGCIRLPAKLAPVLFEHVGVGTQVSIIGAGPDYGNYAAKQRAYAAEQLAKAQERREIEARARAQVAAASSAPAAAAGPAEPVVAMAEPAARPAAITAAMSEPVAAPRTVEPPRERTPAAAPAPRRTAEAPITRPRPAAPRNRPVPPAPPAVALADGTPDQASTAKAPPPAAVAPIQTPTTAPEAAPTTRVQAQPPAGPAPASPTPTVPPVATPAAPPQASPAAVATAPPPSPAPAPAPAAIPAAAPAPAAPAVTKAPEPAAKAPQVAAEAPAAPAPTPAQEQPAPSIPDKPAGG